MAHNLIETPTRGSVVLVPDPGDSRTAASVETPFQSLTNRVAYLEAHAVGVAPGTFFDASAVNFLGGIQDSSSTGSFTYTAHIYLQNSVAGAPKLDFYGKIPLGSILTGAIVYVRGAFSGNHT
ncbi:MAG TPA: hypothetical protein VH062_35685, partial [Polyangiaceae bacterium]|nr:hypothetical protein [Polyangiaceae bacterium]